MTAPPPSAPPPQPNQPSSPAPGQGAASVATSRNAGVPPLLIAALVGALIVIGASFAPWIGNSASGEDASGWQLYDDQIEKVNSGFYFDQSFGNDDAPFFTGLATIVAGAIVGGVALALIAVRGSSNDGLVGVLAFLGIFAGILMAVVAGTDLVAYLRKSDEIPAELKWGLIATWIGALLSLAIIPAALTASSSRSPAASSSPVL